MSVVVIGKDRAIARIRGLRYRTNNPEPMWPVVGQIISAHEAEQFASHGRHFGTPWRPLRPKYLAWKLANGWPRATLVMSGELRASLIGRPMDVEKYEGMKAIFGTANQLAIWHHYGTRYRGKQVNPPRPVIKATPIMAREIAKVTLEHVMGRG